MKRILLNTLSQKWPEYLLEILVLIVGIYGAFALENWNDDRKSKLEQSEIVSNLHGEFLTNRQSLEIHILRLKKKIIACDMIFSYMEKSNELLDTNTADTLITSILRYPTWNPTTFVLTDLRNSGQLKSLQNQKLKSVIHLYEQHIEDLNEMHTMQHNLFNNTTSFLMANGSLRNLMWSLSNHGKTVFADDNRKHFKSLQFENIVSFNLMVSEELLNTYENETMSLIDEILKETI